MPVSTYEAEVLEQNIAGLRAVGAMEAEMDLLYAVHRKELEKRIAEGFCPQCDGELSFASRVATAEGPKASDHCCHCGWNAAAGIEDLV